MRQSVNRFSLLVALSVFLFAYAAKAQRSLDLLTLSGSYSPYVMYEEVPGEASEITSLVNVKIPYEFKNDKTIWITNLTYTYFQVNNTTTLEPYMVDPIKLHGVILQTGIIQKLDDSRAIHFLLAPRFMTDLQNVDSRSFQPGALALFEKKFSEKLLMRFGAMYNQDLFGPMIVPLIHIDWYPKKTGFFVSGLLPIYSKIGYSFNDRFSAGVSHFGLVTSYAIGDPAYSGDYMERKSIDITAFGRYRLAGNFHLEARVGYALDRDYAQYDANDKLDLKITVISIGDDRVRKNERFEDGLIANLRLVYNLPLQ